MLKDYKENSDNEQYYKAKDKLSLKTKRLYFLVIFAVIVVINLFIYFKNPEQIFYVCPSQSIFHIFCSACGLTRSVYHLLHLDIVTAFNYNQFFIISLPLLLYYYISYFLKLFFIIKMPIIKHKKILIFIWLALFLLYGILRNFEIFNFLAPNTNFN